MNVGHRVAQACKDTVYVMHIGKTGGSYLRSVLQKNATLSAGKCRLLPHRYTLGSSAQEFGENRRVAFILRSPSERFVSAFYSRQRQGRPTYNSIWSAKEAAAFMWFDTAEELALALDTSSPARLSAAHFAFEAIQHLPRGYRYHFGSEKALMAERENIAMCIELDQLNAHFPEVMARLGCPEYHLPDTPVYHKAPTPAPPLSPEAEAALRRFWHGEYRLYDIALSFAQDMFSG